MNLPKVTFGIVNCNRLFYLKSCLESLLYCTQDYENKEIIIIDNASIEEGTEDYLKEKSLQGIKVIRQEKRDPANEFAKAMNIIYTTATGEFICPLQGDMQFVLKDGWLKDYVNFYKNNLNTVGCILLDAQRNITNKQHIFKDPVGKDNIKFVADMNRPAVAGAGDVMYSKQVLELLYPWNENNNKHEGGGDSETSMLEKITKLQKDNKVNLHIFLPIISPTVAIYTDSRGTMARVRDNKRYGDYWKPKDNFRYYATKEYNDLIKDKKMLEQKIPVGIESIAEAVGWELPIDQFGNWKKNPIRMETATKNDYVVLYENVSVTNIAKSDEGYLNDWLNE